MTRWRSGHAKLHVTAVGLALRRERPQSFASGEYQPLALIGPEADRAIVFARNTGTEAAICVAPRICHGLLEGSSSPIVPTARWGATAVCLPPSLRNFAWTNALVGGDSINTHEGQVPLTSLHARFPVALLVSGTPSSSCAPDGLPRARLIIVEQAAPNPKGRLGRIASRCRCVLARIIDQAVAIAERGIAAP